MTAITILLVIEAVLFAAAYLAAGRRLHLAAIYLLCVTAPLEVYRTTLGGVNPSLFRLSVGIAVLVLLVEIGRPRGAVLATVKRSLRNRLVQAYLLFAAVVAISLVINPAYTFLGHRLLASVGVGVLAVALIVVLGHDLAPSRIAPALALGCVLPIAAGVWQAFAVNRGWDPALPFLDQLPLAEGLEKSRDTAAYLGDTTRERGTFADTNHFGALLNIGLLVALALGVRELVARRTPRAVGYIALAVACGSSLLATYSRSAWLGAAVGALLFAILCVPLVRRHLSRRTAVIGGVALVLAGSAVIVPLAPTLGDRLDSSRGENQVSNRSHGETIDSAWSMFTDSPFLGEGVGAIGVALDQGERTSGAHSSYLTVAAELGLVGLLVLVVAAVVVLWRLSRCCGGWDAIEEDRVLFAGILAGYVAFLVSAALYDLWFDDFHWMILALVAALTASQGGRVRRHGAFEHPLRSEVARPLDRPGGVPVPGGAVGAQLSDR